MVSYALEESNNYIDAEFYARISLDIYDKDLQSIHTLCHLHDSNQHNSDGIHVLNDKKLDINGKDNLKSLNIVFVC